MSAARDNEDIRRLFSEHVPEIVSGAVSIVGIAREKGLRAMVAVSASTDSVCPVGSCIGMKGERVKTIMKQLPGDKIDIVRWADTTEDFIRNLLAPARVERITFERASHRATVAVAADSTERLTKDGGIRLRLASRLAGWDLQMVAI